MALILGVRHAFEPDHIAAVSNLVADRTRASRFPVGVLWGVGHALSLFVLAVVLVAVEASLSERLMQALELGVAAMLIVLGARSIVRALAIGPRGPSREHAHGARSHTHGGSLDHVHVGGLMLASGPLWVGAVHGLAGSGALTALAVSAMPSAASRLLYVVMFGLGSIAGMGALTTLVSMGLHRLRAATMSRGLLASAGVFSVSLGVWMAVPLARAL